MEKIYNLSYHKIYIELASEQYKICIGILLSYMT